MNVGSIAGGTNAGWRRVKQAHPEWFCRCPWPSRIHRALKKNPGWRSECSDCGVKRPT